MSWRILHAESMTLYPFTTLPHKKRLWYLPDRYRLKSESSQPRKYKCIKCD